MGIWRNVQIEQPQLELVFLAEGCIGIRQIDLALAQ
ncbi:hypothetical protein HRbin20_00454 [bacterium HR20]|nr:hypothetical protein HRbin20_00454 [bacterium HR20]